MDFHGFPWKVMDMLADLEAKIIELDKNRNNVVLSRRAWLEETQKEQREEFLDNLQPGEKRSGVVSSVVSFGAFVDLGGMDGQISKAVVSASPTVDLEVL